jgi:hypothetical protein
VISSRAGSSLLSTIDQVRRNAQRTDKGSDSDDDVFVDKLNRRANEQNKFLSGYNLNHGEVGGPQHGISGRDFAYE